MFVNPHGFINFPLLAPALPELFLWLLLMEAPQASRPSIRQ